MDAGSPGPGGIQAASLQEETKGPLSGLPWFGAGGASGSASGLPLASLASQGFLARGQLSGLTIAVPPSRSQQLGSSAWGPAQPLPLPLSPRQGASCEPPSTQRPHLTPHLGMGLCGCGAQAGSPRNEEAGHWGPLVSLPSAARRSRAS